MILMLLDTGLVNISKAHEQSILFGDNSYFLVISYEVLDLLPIITFIDYPPDYTYRLSIPACIANYYLFNFMLIFYMENLYKYHNYIKI